MWSNLHQTSFSLHDRSQWVQSQFSTEVDNKTYANHRNSHAHVCRITGQEFGTLDVTIPVLRKHQTVPNRTKLLLTGWPNCRKKTAHTMMKLMGNGTGATGATRTGRREAREALSLSLLWLSDLTTLEIQSGGQRTQACWCFEFKRFEKDNQVMFIFSIWICLDLGIRL